MATTRLRLVRRLIFARIIVIGIALALAQFEAARGWPPRSSLVGRAGPRGGLRGARNARQRDRRGHAGHHTADRIGDLVTFDDETGEVEDVGLTYTYLRLDDGSRLVVPTSGWPKARGEPQVVDPRIQVEASIWIPPGADADRAIELIASEEDGVTRVAEVERDGVRSAPRPGRAPRASAAGGPRRCADLARRL